MWIIYDFLFTHCLQQFDYLIFLWFPEPLGPVNEIFFFKLEHFWSLFLYFSTSFFLFSFWDFDYIHSRQFHSVPYVPEALFKWFQYFLVSLESTLYWSICRSFPWCIQTVFRSIIELLFHILYFSLLKFPLGYFL